MPLNGNPFKRFGCWVRDLIVQDMPEAIALCELDCRKEQCTIGEWEGCERRLKKAGGQLMPVVELMPPDYKAFREGTTGDSDGGDRALARE